MSQELVSTQPQGLSLGTTTGRKRDPDLLREKQVVPLEKHINTSNLGFLIWISPLLHFYQLGKLENNKAEKNECGHEVSRLVMGSWLDQNSPNRRIIFSLRTSSAKICNQHKEYREKATQMLKFHKHVYSSTTHTLRSHNIFVHNTYSHNRNQKKIQTNKQTTNNKIPCTQCR